MSILSENYGKWFQSEVNSSEIINGMIRSIDERLNNIESLSPEEVWELVRSIGYLNHSAFKVNPLKWSEYPDEKLSDEDFSLNKRIYAAKKSSLVKLADYYIRHNLNASMNPEGTMIMFYNPVNNVRQISFHFKPSDFTEQDWSILNRIPNKEDQWSGVKMAHRYGNDEDYIKAQKAAMSSMNEDVEVNDIDLSSFELKDELNPDIWNDDKHINQRVRRQLLRIARDFLENVEIEDLDVDDVTMTGSLANYNWDEKYSDIDLHIIADLEDEILKKYLDEARKNWNNSHEDLTVMGFPVELYVQDIDEPHRSTGVYSILYDKWLTEPSKKKIENGDLDEKKIKKTASHYMNEINELFELFREANGEDEYEELYNKSDSLFDEIKETRKRSMSQKDAEMSEGNIIFKTLRRFGYIEKLLAIRRKCYDAFRSL